MLYLRTYRLNYNTRNYREHKQSKYYLTIQIGPCLVRIVAEVKPVEIYNLAAMSHVKISFQTAEYTADVDGVGTLRLLEAIRTVGISDKAWEKQVNNSDSI